MAQPPAADDVTPLLRRWSEGDPTAPVHEMYLRLVDQRNAMWKNRVQFFGIAARLMRRVLVDQARAPRAKEARPLAYARDARRDRRGAG